MESSTIDYLLEQLKIVLDNYTCLDTLKKDIYEYAFFMKDVYAQATYFSEFYHINKEYQRFMEINHYHKKTFSDFQRHLILRCLFEGYTFAEINEFAKAGIDDSEMEKAYYHVFMR